MNQCDASQKSSQNGDLRQYKFYAHYGVGASRQVSLPVTVFACVFVLMLGKTCCDHGGENTLYLPTGVFCREVRLSAINRPVIDVSAQVKSL